MTCYDCMYMDRFGECKKWDSHESYFIGIIDKYTGVIRDQELYFSFLAENCKFYTIREIIYH